MRKKRIGRRAVITIVSIVVAVGVAAGLVVPRVLKIRQASSGEDLSYARTVTLAKGTLADVVKVNGVIQSSAVSTVTASFTSKVIAVNVSVGDHVEKGDVICTLDTTDLDKQIAQKREDLGDAGKTLKSDYDKANTQLTNAKANRATAGKEQDALVAAATAARDNAQKALASVQPALNTAKAQYDTMMKGVQPYVAAQQTAEAARQTAYNAWLTAGGQTVTSETDPTPPAEYTAYQAAETAATAAATELANAKTLYDFTRYQDAYTAAQSAYNDRNSAFIAAQSALNDASALRQKTLNDLDSAVTDLIAQVQTASDKMKKGVSSQDLDDLLAKKKEATLTAQTAGEVTELNVTVGGVPKDTVAKIQSTKDLILTVSIPESDINRVHSGLSARIKTDAISKPAAGTLVRISQTASGGDNGSSAGYSADISIQDSTGLHIGSKAQAEIILASKDGVFTVPIDAVGTDASGASFIRQMLPDKSTQNIPVTTGDKNDTLIEVSGPKLSEGMEILADAEWNALSQQTAADTAAAQEGTGL